MSKTPLFTEGFIEAFEEDPSQFIGRTISEHEAYEMYNEMLDDHEGVNIGGVIREYSHVLKSVDPIMYRVGFNDYISHLEEDHIYVEGYTEPPQDS